MASLTLAHLELVFYLTPGPVRRMQDLPGWIYTEGLRGSRTCSPSVWDKDAGRSAGASQEVPTRSRGGSRSAYLSYPSKVHCGKNAKRPVGRSRPHAAVSGRASREGSFCQRKASPRK